jgi:hypothetical protein
MIFNVKSMSLTLVMVAFILGSSESRPDSQRPPTDTVSSVATPSSYDKSVASPESRSLLYLNPWAPLTALGAEGASQLGNILAALGQYVAQLFPHVAAMVQNLPPGIKIPIRGFFEYYNVTSIGGATQQSMRYLNLDTFDCQLRMVCEVSSYFAERLHLSESLIKQMTPIITLNPSNPMSRALIEGLMRQNCSEPFPQCPKSPLSVIKDSMRSLHI